MGQPERRGFRSIKRLLHIEDAVTPRTFPYLQKSTMCKSGRRSPKSTREKAENLYFPVFPITLRTSDFTKDLHQAPKLQRIPDTEEGRTSRRSFYEASVTSNTRLRGEKYERSTGQPHSWDVSANVLTKYGYANWLQQLLAQEFYSRNARVIRYAKPSNAV